MGNLYDLAQGFVIAVSVQNLLYAMAGVTVGQIIGLLPGLGPITGLSLLVPIVFGLDPTSGLIMLSGVYYGAMFGGAITSILLNTPGDAAAVVTTLDGYPLARAGQAGRALGVAAMSSFIGGTVAVLGLTFVMPILARFALAFGPAEYTLLVLMAFLTTLGFSTRSRVKGAISTLIGLALGTVGQDVITGQTRFTFGNPDLLGGIDFAVVAIGLFAVGEILVRLDEDHPDEEQKPMAIQGVLVTAADMRTIARPVAEGSVIGFLVGLLPGAGATISAFLAYAVARASSRTPEMFGKGALEGVAAPESANNAAVGGALVPMLALGVPGSGSTAVLLGAMMVLGLNPGPMFLTENAAVAWAVVASMYIGNVMLLIMNIPMIRIFAALLAIRYAYIAVGVIVLSVVGAYSISNSMFDVWVMAAFAAVGYVMKKNDFPMAPLILALVLGDLLESNWRRSLLAAQGSYDIFVGSTLSLIIIGIILMALCGPWIWRLVRRQVLVSGT